MYERGIVCQDLLLNNFLTNADEHSKHTGQEMRGEARLHDACPNTAGHSLCQKQKVKEYPSWKWPQSVNVTSTDSQGERVEHG
ncbi:hypothetical protein EG68_01424 [Paragonimus skrjabini miyazakii]|uniref:Uncharacterized protein n=1 Tax=Paragonimus skrjabini miyazakii TaxID=59628 RepID=A0A8S9Z3N2_9TREM|nr:hypothetical protein EG68_01424 [Paragonimus skrjabini miyazakii]